MLCPHCGEETSDMMTRCELCGLPLFGPGGEETPCETMGIPSAGDSFEFGPGGTPVSEWPHPGGGYYAYQSTRRTGGRWYNRPAPYIVGIIVAAAAVFVFILATRGGAAYPELLVNNQATMLNFYADW